MTPRVWPIWVWLAGFMWETTSHHFILNLLAISLMVPEKKMFEAYDPWGVANLVPRGLIGRIFVGGHYTLLHTKYISSGPHGYREEDFLSFFPILSLWELMTLEAYPVWVPGT